MRASILDKLVQAERPKDDDDKQGQSISFPTQNFGLSRSMAQCC